jgi:hypothetical protein
MKLRLLCVTTLLLFATEAAGAYAADGARKSFEIFRTDSPPIIDGTRPRPVTELRRRSEP